ncbi:MAG TPA: hypothetical protein IGR64_16750 [Leptolyngbyaceae cyanobacterium M65_K2018_010]|nr:hypothetical protein [Leptolyngbyaceae cyanobacterium M65_K2018_010]
MVSQEIPATDWLGQAAHRPGPRPDPTTVTTALLDAERRAKRDRLSLAEQTLLGTWKLRFTAPKKSAYKAGQPTGQGFYWPAMAPASISFSRSEQTPTALTIQNQLQVGPLQLRFSGPAKFLPKKNLLAFDFLRLQLYVGAWRLLNLPIGGKTASPEAFATTPIAQLPFFAFFAATDRYLAARGRGGGLALWVKG